MLILDILIHGSLHLTDYPPHRYLRHVVNLNARVREEQFRQVLKEEAEERVLKYRVFHRLEYMVEILDMLADRWVAIELAFLVEAERDLELCPKLTGAENALEFRLVSVQHLNQVGRQVARDELHELVVQALSVDGEGELPLDMLVLGSLLAKHDDRLMVRLVLEHLFDLRVLDRLYIVLIIFFDFLLQGDQCLLNVREDGLERRFALFAALLASLLEV